MTANAVPGTGGGLHHEIQEVTAQMEMLRVPELKAVCRSLALPIAGRKADLQDRIRTYLKDSCTIGNLDPWRPKAIRILIGKVKLGESLPKYDDLWKTLRTGAYFHPVATGHQPVSSLQQSPRTSAVSAHGYAAWPSEDTKSEVPKPAAAKRPCLYFKPTPFYKMIKLIPETAQKINITSVRGACVAKFKLSKPDWTMLESDKKYKLYLLCGAYGNSPSPTGEYIQFPHPNEIRFNNVQVKDNVRGLKNKLGTAKPADLTPYLKPSPQQNVLEVVYAFTKNEYCIYCYIVEVVTPESLLEEVLKKPKIIKAATLNYIKKCLSEEEDDLITTSTVMTLQCPVSYTRMKYPAKSIMCNHLQCFDALWYIYSQLQVPTWQCPVCQIDIKLGDLAICEYVDEILKNSGDDVEQVELSTDGSWKPIDEEVIEPKETPKSSETFVKKEYNENNDETNMALSKPLESSRTVTPANEAVVISLDSDSDEDANDQSRQDPNAQRSQNADTLNSASQNGSYMDHRPSPTSSTLDPRVYETNTPTVPRQMTEANANSLSYVDRNQEVPNILGKTPLNNGKDHQETPLQEPASPTPVSNNRGQYTPALSASASPNGLEERDSQERDDVNKRAALPPSLRRPSNPQTTSILGLTGQVSRPPDIGGPMLPTTTDNGSIASDNSGIQNGINTAYNPTEHESVVGVPRLPPLPFHSFAPSMGNPALDMPLPRNHTPVNSTIVHPPPPPPLPAYSRAKKPIVSPFIPKKPYLNLLPQKRHIANNSPPSPHSFGSDPHSFGASATEGSRRSDDIIDLTSD